MPPGDCAVGRPVPVALSVSPGPFAAAWPLPPADPPEPAAGPDGRAGVAGSPAVIPFEVACSTSSSRDIRAVSAATSEETPSRISVSRLMVSVCLVDSRFRRRSAPSWIAVARAVASSSAFLAWAFALASTASDFFLASDVVLSASARAAVTVFSASARAEVMARSACSWAAVSIRSACSRASERALSASC